MLLFCLWVLATWLLNDRDWLGLFFFSVLPPCPVPPFFSPLSISRRVQSQEPGPAQSFFCLTGVFPAALTCCVGKFGASVNSNLRNCNLRLV